MHFLNSTMQRCIKLFDKQRRSFLCLCLFTVLFFVQGTDIDLRAQSTKFISMGPGVVANIPSKLTIKQHAEQDISLNARYDSRALDDPIYYVIKVGFRLFQNDWQAQFVHHKLYLKDPPAEVQQFQVSHGFNIFTMNRVIDFKKLYFLAGAGIVIPHAESEVRNKKYDEGGGILGTGYTVTGPVLTVGLGKEAAISKRVFMLFEAQFSGAWAKVGVAQGEARLSNFALHAAISLGYRI